MRANETIPGGPTVGHAVRRRRLFLALTSEEVARRAGCSKGYLSSIEHERKSPSPHILRCLEIALELPDGALLNTAAWACTPVRVRRELAALQAKERAASELVHRLRAGGLDQAYRDGTLRDLVEAIAPDEPATASPALIAVPLESRVPLINRVPAGYPREFTDLGYPARVATESISCPDLSDPDAFACRVVGDSMEPDYREGDIVVFSPARPLRSGLDCFARLEPRHETTFKRVYFEHDERGREVIRLQPLNNRYPARVVDREGVAGLYAAARVMRAVP